MSRKLERSLQGPGEVVSAPLSFAQRYVAAGFTLPDQAIIAHMRRATEVGLDWAATAEEINEAEMNGKHVSLFVLELDEYSTLKKGTYGSPMPRQVAEHIERVKEKFPDAQVSLEVHVVDDPFVRIVLDGECLYPMAWRRHGLEICDIFPK